MYLTVSPIALHARQALRAGQSMIPMYDVRDIYTYHWCNEDPRIPGLAPVVPEKFRDGEFALRTSGIPWLAPNPRPHQKIDTKPKPGDFSIGLHLLSQYNFPMKIHKHSLLFLCPFSISRRVNAKTISKFESNGNTLLPRRIIFFFH